MTEESKSLPRILDAVSRALRKYPAENVDVVGNEETGKMDVNFHSRNNSFAIESGVAMTDNIDKKALARELDSVGVGHCW